MDSWEVLRAKITKERERITGEVFGEKLGFTRGYISRLESGKAQFSEEILNRLAEYFGKPVHELCTPTSETEKFIREIETMKEMKAMFEQMLEDRDLKDILIGEWKKLRRTGQLHQAHQADQVPQINKKKE
jgi:transcriptional regulator with XRE-family HTH domain